MNLDFEGGRIAFDDFGAGDVILFIHAGIANRTMWERQVMEFSRTHRVIACDLRGFGGSTMPAGEFAYADDLRGLLDVLHIEQATVVGISFGGNVALDFAIASPERLRGLVLVSTLAAMSEPSDVLKRVWRDSEAAFESGDIDSATAIEMTEWIDGGRPTESLDPAFRLHAESMIRQIWQRAALGEEEGEARELDPPAKERLHELRVPVLLVQGDHELPDVPLSMQRIAEGIPNSTSHVIDNASHLAPLERPAEFNRLLRDHLATL